MYAHIQKLTCIQQRQQLILLCIVKIKTIYGKRTKNFDLNHNITVLWHLLQFCLISAKPMQHIKKKKKKNGEKKREICTQKLEKINKTECIFIKTFFYNQVAMIHFWLGLGRSGRLGISCYINKKNKNKVYQNLAHHAQICREPKFCQWMANQLNQMMFFI